MIPFQGRPFTLDRSELADEVVEVLRQSNVELCPLLAHVPLGDDTCPNIQAAIRRAKPPAVSITSFVISSVMFRVGRATVWVCVPVGACVPGEGCATVSA